MDSLEERRHILCLKFAKNGIKNNNLNDLFSENDKTHRMKTRAVKKYKVQHANTERLRNSGEMSKDEEIAGADTLENPLPQSTKIYQKVQVIQ